MYACIYLYVCGFLYIGEQEEDLITCPQFSPGSIFSVRANSSRKVSKMHYSLLFLIIVDCIAVCHSLVAYLITINCVVRRSPPPTPPAYSGSPYLCICTYSKTCVRQIRLSRIIHKSERSDLLECDCIDLLYNHLHFMVLYQIECTLYHSALCPSIILPSDSFQLHP